MILDLTLLLSALAAHLLDAALTAVLVSYAGARELNPVFRPIADKFLLLAAVKVAMIGLAWHYPNGRFFVDRRFSMRLLAKFGWGAVAWNTGWAVYALAKGRK